MRWDVIVLSALFFPLFFVSNAWALGLAAYSTGARRPLQ
jgi:hypothetical protein